MGRRVEIAGEVKSPQTLYLDNIPLRISDALVKTGGFAKDSNPAEVTLIRGGKATVLNLMSYYEEGDLKQNWLLLDGDSVHVGSMSLSQVFVFGEVKNMGRAPCSAVASRSRRRSATAPASTTPPCAPPCTCSARRPRGSPEIFRLDVAEADSLILAAQFPLKPRDVVFVATNDLARMNRVISQILPLVNTIWQTWSMIYTTKTQIGF